ncbi:hypothetical protein F511_28929 [Dorcoceras hygrometricum]|uniref:Uncharacterized protein n=1 Tax=Dorcoceras hygrometricum TaxID=472368 RepID=A0A2Z7BC91_9LAMI|nr:hypothetical protein F511_28929 [Dorcoceras hygrometricum]
MTLPNSHTHNILRNKIESPASPFHKQSVFFCFPSPIKLRSFPNLSRLFPFNFRRP